MNDTETYTTNFVFEGTNYEFVYDACNELVRIFDDNGHRASILFEPETVLPPEDQVDPRVVEEAEEFAVSMNYKMLFS